jgi:hypothetical protein
MDIPLAIIGEIDDSSQGLCVSSQPERSSLFVASILLGVPVISYRPVHETRFTSLGLAIITKGQISRRRRHLPKSHQESGETGRSS